MIGSWSNRIIEESRCHTQDQHALDTPEPDVNYVALRLAQLVGEHPGLGNAFTAMRQLLSCLNRAEPGYGS